MFYRVQKRITLWFVLILTGLAALVFLMYYLSMVLLDWGWFWMMGSFLVLAFIGNRLLTMLVKRTHYWMTMKMVRKNQIALSKIKSVKLDKEMRDLYFKPHSVYEFTLEVYDQDFNKSSLTIFEAIDPETDLKIFPTWSYVTYDQANSRFGIIPTFSIFITPNLKPLIQKFEKRFHPDYVEISQPSDFLFKSFGNSDTSQSSWQRNPRTPATKITARKGSKRH